MAKRRIVKARRSLSTTTAAGTHSNPFAASGSKAARNPFAALGEAAPKVDNASATCGVKEGDEVKGAGVEAQKESAKVQSSEPSVKIAEGTDKEEGKEAKDVQVTKASETEQEAENTNETLNGANKHALDNAHENQPSKPLKVGENKAPVDSGDAEGETRAAGPAPADSSAAKGITSNTEGVHVEASKQAVESAPEGEKKASDTPKADENGNQGETKTKSVPIFGSGTRPKLSFGFLSNSAPDAKKFAEMAKKAKPVADDEPTTETKGVFNEPERVVTGEEEDDTMFKTRAKLYGLVNQEKNTRWKEEGVGNIKINVHRVSRRSRILMRTSGTLRLLLNAPIWKELKIDRASDKSARMVVVQPDDGTLRSILLRFSKEKDLDEFIKAIEAAKN